MTNAGTGDNSEDNQSGQVMNKTGQVPDQSHQMDKDTANAHFNDLWQQVLSDDSTPHSNNVDNGDQTQSISENTQPQTSENSTQINAISGHPSHPHQLPDSQILCPNSADHTNATSCIDTEDKSSETTAQVTQTDQSIQSLLNQIAFVLGSTNGSCPDQIQFQDSIELNILPDGDNDPPPLFSDLLAPSDPLEDIFVLPTMES